MTPFLKQAAQHYFSAGNIDKRIFVFPNKRSMAFFRKYLAEEVADTAKNASLPEHGGKARPVLMPEMLTINDFFCKAAGATVTDRVTLLLELYDCYKSLNPQAEGLDDFIYWGDVILADFNDVDKYLVNPEAVFTNVAEFKEMSDTFSYLTEEQKNAIRQFVKHFREGADMIVVPGMDNPDMKGRFLQIWDILGELYKLFGQTLVSKGLIYEGLAYRHLAEKTKDTPVVDVLDEYYPGCSSFVFIGLNALNECEKTLMRKMRDAGIAEFCWDYQSDMIKDPGNKSSVFMTTNVTEFPQKWDLDPEGLPQKEINVISVPSASGQVKQLPGIFNSVATSANVTLSEVGSIGAGTADCAVVLPDETLLMTVLNTIPPQIPDINVTMGYPMSGSEFYLLMTHVVKLQLHIRKKDSVNYFYKEQIEGILSNGVFKKIARDEDNAVIREIRLSGRFYHEAKAFEASPLMKAIFRPVVTDPKSNSAAQIESFADYLSEVVMTVAPKLKDDPTMAPEMEFAQMYFVALNRLKVKKLEILSQTFARLLSQLLSSQSVHYSGEPLKGLQIMGPLETRCLDFNNLVILSCNEGVFPRKNVSPSFIPAELRKGFALPTYEFQDAVWAYYFYRMIQRASKIWLVCDSRTEALHTREESRYIKQLQYHFHVDMKRYVSVADSSSTDMPLEIQKPSDIADIVKSMQLSASSVETYLHCPAKFYYRYVCGLKTDDQTDESLDSRTLGLVYHSAMQALYLGEVAMRPDFVMSKERIQKAISSGELVPMKEVTADYLKSWLTVRKTELRQKIRALIMQQLNVFDIEGKNIVLADVILKYVEKTIEVDLNLCRSHGSFRILGLERKFHWQYEGYSFMGYIDRLDSFADDEIRVIDYKTGVVSDEEMAVTDKNAVKVADQLFKPDVASRPKIAFQVFLYDRFVESVPEFSDKKRINAIYSTSRLFKENMEGAPENAQFSSEVCSRLKDTLEEISDASVPFRRTATAANCEKCDFKDICGR